MGCERWEGVRREDLEDGRARSVYEGGRGEGANV